MSVVGLLPLGIYVVLHLWTNVSSLGGPCAFNTALHASRNHPAFLVLEILLGISIVLHTTVGIALMLKWRANNRRSPFFGNIKFLLQRLSGIGLLLFIIAHVINARIRPSLDGRGSESYHGMREALHEPLTLAVYLLGVFGVSYHLANGLWSFCITWGLTVTPQAQRKSQFASFVLFAGLVVLSGCVLYGFFQPMQAAWLLCK